jgi:hypothetical protein
VLKSSSELCLRCASRHTDIIWRQSFMIVITMTIILSRVMHIEIFDGYYTTASFQCFTSLPEFLVPFSKSFFNNCWQESVFPLHMKSSLYECSNVTITKIICIRYDVKLFQDLNIFHIDLNTYPLCNNYDFPSSVIRIFYLKHLLKLNLNLTCFVHIFGDHQRFSF